MNVPEVVRAPLAVDLRGRVALVTGGGTGIGRAISIGLARCGATVAISFRRSQEEAETTLREIEAAGGSAWLHRCDVAAEDDVAALAAAVHARAGGLDILVANAGGPVVAGVSTEAISAQQWAAGLATNCDSIFYCVKHMAPLLPAPGGRIIVTSSISARTGARPGGLNYAAAKGAVNNMVRTGHRSWARAASPSTPSPQGSSAPASTRRVRPTLSTHS